MARKEDLRVRKTKKSIAEAFMALLEEKTYEEITVNELCDRAGVRRTTFYKHYKDKLDYVACFAKDLREKFDDIIWKNGKPDSTPDYYVAYAKSLVDFISRHETVVNNIIKSPAFSAIAIVLSEQNYKDTYDRLMVSIKAGMELCASAEVVSGMIVGAVSSAITLWLRGGRKMPADQLAEEIGAMVKKAMA
jgi:AcrR family transcriptional regulator